MHEIIKEDLEFIVSAKLTWDDFEGKTVLISGGNGLLPGYMVETILFLNDQRYKFFSSWSLKVYVHSFQIIL